MIMNMLKECKCENNKGKNRVSTAKWKSCKETYGNVRSAKCIGMKNHWVRGRAG